MRRTDEMKLFFDYVSPYSYLASTQAPAVAARYGVRLELVPVLFAPMLDASGARGPGEIPRRRDYMFHDICRLARRFPSPPNSPRPNSPLAIGT